MRVTRYATDVSRVRDGTVDWADSDVQDNATMQPVNAMLPSDTIDLPSRLKLGSRNARIPDGGIVCDDLRSGHCTHDDRSSCG
ncbi:MAG TPA: hypothetical protein VJ803_07965 [Gemmatimonadaceae bacterium]|nr:hypothetical protein [Gemmatimonadaceae bacterium]